MDQLKDYTCIIQIPVQWGDMDAYQHVNNIRYLRWIESARVRYFEEYMNNEPIEKADVGPILAWQDAKYIFPMTYPDTAHIGYRVTEILEDRLICDARIYSERHNRLAIISHNVIMPYSLSKLAKAPIPKEWIDAINKNNGN